MAHILELEGDDENAVNSYKRSLELNSNQKDVIIKSKNTQVYFYQLPKINTLVVLCYKKEYD